VTSLLRRACSYRREHAEQGNRSNLYLRRDIAVACREQIEASPELTDSERTGILGRTAMKLFPRLASLPSKTQTSAP
jgi:hypothetical protein